MFLDVDMRKVIMRVVLGALLRKRMMSQKLDMRLAIIKEVVYSGLTNSDENF